MAQKITIIGTGLIGGSLGLALKQAGIDAEIVGHDKDSGAAALAKKRGAVDRTDWNLINSVDQAALVIIATPIAAIKPTLEIIAEYLMPGAIVTDTTSVKQQVLAWAEAILPASVHFVGGHPLTNAVGTGIDAASPTLFAKRPYCLMAGARAGEAAMETMSNLAHMIGAHPYFIDPAEHDAFVAAVEHLPVLAAAALVHAAAGSPSWREIGKLAAGAFEQATLPVTGNADAYAGICDVNRDSIVRWLNEYISTLVEMREVVQAGGADLKDAFTRAQAERARWLATRDDEEAETPPPPKVDGTGRHIRDLLFGGLMKEPPELPAKKR
jgi:prephenate dehydrogenase